MNEIQKIRDQYDEPIFRMALYHLIDKGKDHFTEELVAEAKQSIRKQDDQIKSEKKLPFMSVGFQDSLIDCAAALARFETTNILRFVKHYMYFEGDEKLTIYCKDCGQKTTPSPVVINEDYEDAFCLCERCHDLRMEEGSIILCESCGSYYTPNHCKDDGENEDGDTTCPYCSD